MKSVKIFVILSILSSAFVDDAFAQSKKYFFSMDGEKRYIEEFNYAYAKNNLTKENKRDSIDAYLELYINFRLKVKEAKSLGYDTTIAFKEEFSLYKKQLEESYLSPKKAQKALILEAYERSLWEIRASHILITVPKDASPSDTLVAFNKIKELRNRVLEGENFGQLAMASSQDPSAKQNNGDLGYFSVFQMVYPFEEAAFNTKVGEVSNPIRTQFGYHILLIVDKRANEGKLKVAHIMIRSTSKNNEEFKTKAKDKAFLIDSLLKTGSDWDSLCRAYSEDQNSIAQNGQLKPFARGQIVPEFEKVAFSLTKEGDISTPIKTQFGWHIIKLIDKLPVGTYEDEKSNLARRIKSDSRSSMPRAEMIKTLKEQNGFYVNEDAVSALLQLPPSVFIKNKWHFDSLQLVDKTKLFSIGDKQTILKGGFLKSIQGKSNRSGVSQKIALNKLLTDYGDSLVIDFEKKHLSQKYPDYGFLVNEYYDGILLFSIMEDSVWNLSMKDSTGLRSFYENNRDRYAEQASDTIVFSSDEKATLDKIRLNSLDDENIYDLEQLNVQLAKEYNVSPLTLQIISNESDEWDKIHAHENRESNVPFEMDKKWYLIKVVDVIKPKPLNENKGKVISDYQSYLDAKWIESLKKKYPVKVNRKQLNKVYAHFKATN